MDQYFAEYVNMTDEERMLYHYVASKDGKDAGLSYLDILDDGLNQQQGLYQAMDYISTLNRDDADFDAYMLEHGDANGDKKLTKEDIGIISTKKGKHFSFFLL